MSETLNAMSFPLWGSRLIEASAGTGKTWTIAALYLRLVLGHGGAAGFARPLMPSEILVMTFTRAATRELSDRIRSRLLEAARCFRAEDKPDQRDSLLIALIADYPEESDRAAAAWRLAMAAQSMDDAAVHTIDAWCQRMLREHAFDSACLFDEELTADEQAMFAEAAQDYWRQQLYPMAGEVLDAALTVWKNIAVLKADAQELLKQDLPEGHGIGDLTSLVKQLMDDRQRKVAKLKVGWAARAKNMQAWLDAAVADKFCPFDKKKVQARFYTPWLGAIAAWAEDSRADALVLSDAASRLMPARLHEAVKPGAVLALPDDFNAFAELMQGLAHLPTMAGGMRLHAASSMARRLSELKNQAGTFGFADMLNRLDAALDAAANGEAASRLRCRMLAQYPVAMIDEFQDTSPLQVRIFDRLYRIDDNDPTSALLLIGDPKQSIYGFRGADIYSYLKTRRATEGRHYVLGTNHRSTVALVAAVNHLFEDAEATAGEGAFMFRSDPAPGSDNPLPFVAVGAKGRTESFVTSAGIGPALLLELDPKLMDAAGSRLQFAALCAEHIVTLLNDEKAGFDHGPKGFIRLRPADIAVLVRTGNEAAAVRRELRRRNVASVYLSDKDSVFASDEARDLLHWLRAVAAPLDARLARAALATRTVGLSVDELLVLAADDEAFDARSEQLRQLHAVWLSQGVLAMLRKSLHLLDLPGRWLGSRAGTKPCDPSVGQPGSSIQAGADGERRLTNFLHLAELLQAASALLEGEQALIRWLSSQMEGDSSTGDEQIVRLESDADLVKVVTVHKSKGLEYPLVLLPFASSFRGVNNARTRFVNLADDDGNRTLHVEPSAEQLAAYDKDRHREDLRLLYVALTRARHALWVGVSALKEGHSKDCSFHRSAGGYLLGSRAQTSETALVAQIENLVKPCADIALAEATPADQIARTWFRVRGTPPALREIAPYAGSFERRWSIASFSALVRALAAPVSLNASLAAARDDEVLGRVAGGSPDSAGDLPLMLPFMPLRAKPPQSASQPWHRFPRGAMPGNFLHDQLEWLAGEGFALESPAVEQRLLMACDREAWKDRRQEVLTWLREAVRTPLPPTGATLELIRNPLPEMEFWFPSDGLLSAEIDALCRAQLLNGRDRPLLPERELRGMLMGFADIVFEHQGRYWVLDYKSNYLGPGDSDYATDALELAMAAHRYDVQAAIYMLALHRLLRARLGPRYDPARQLGGAIYFFLRGIQGPASGCYHVPPRLELLAGLDAMLGHHEELV